MYSFNRRLMQALGWAEVGDAHLEEDWPIVAGTVTNPTGSWSGNSLAGLVDAYTGNWSGYEDPYQTIQAQWQHWVLLSATTGACGREGGGGSFAAGEITLRFLLVGTIAIPGHADTFLPVADLPYTFNANGTWVTTSDGVLRQAKGYAMKAKSTGSAGTDTLAAGTVTFSRADAVQYEGSYDLNFGSGAVTGAFVAPWCGTPPA